MANNTNSYLEYLDKEMTIMGILSTFCVAVVALVIDRVGGAEPAKKTLFSLLWETESDYLLIGSACIGLAAALFYQQRSALAWFYGQLSLSIEQPGTTGLSTEEWYREADSWATWVPYQSAFTSLAIGLAFYAYALILQKSLLRIPIWVVLSIVGFAAAIQVGRVLIFHHYKYEDDPLASFRESIFKRKVS